MAQSSAVIRRVIAQRAGGEPILDLRYETLGPSLRALGTPRSVLFNALRKTAEEAGVEIISDTQVKAVVPLARGARVEFQHGASSEFDFVVVADGIKSSVGKTLGFRRASFDYAHEAVWTTGELGDS